MPVPDPVAFRVFNIDIMWYGVLIVSAMILAVALSCLRSRRHDVTSDQMLNIALICIPTAIIGARAYYVLFHWSWYAGDFLKMINIRGGGLAIHGGLIFGFGMGVILCLIWKLRPFDVLDLVAPCVALAQAIGRGGNYFNSEAHGGPTDLPWAVTIDGQTYHPTFLYESIWCLILFLILIYVDNHRKFEGQTILLYGILYSIERFFVEALRTDSLMIGPFKQAQVISLVIIVVCIILYVILQRKSSRNRC